MSAVPESAAGHGTRGRILLVEDHLDTSIVMQRILAKRGYAVTAETNADVAMVVALGEHFDLLICDIGLPVMTGWELFKRVRRERPIRGIALSGHALDEDVQQSIEAGFQAHLTKPIEFDKLIAAVEAALGTRS